MRKRFTTFLLLLALIAGLLPLSGVPAQAALPKQLSSSLQTGTVTKSLLARQLADKNADDPVKVLITYQAPQGGMELYAKKADAVDRLAMGQQVVASMAQKIAAQGIVFHSSIQFQYLLYGAAGTTTVSEALALEKLPGIHRVELDPEFLRPEPIRPAMDHSVGLIQAPDLWTLGYKGEGQVVAIIDSGADPLHQDLTLSDASKARWKTQAEATAFIQEKKLAGRYFSSKIPYGYNYAQRNDLIKELKAGGDNHGMHVAGTIAGNGNPEVGRTRGVAPEAQLMIMRVFGENSESTNASLYIKAIEDSVIMGADTINMSLGAPAGTLANIGEGTLNAIKAASEAGIVVNIAVGNEGHFGFRANLPSSDAPDIGLTGTPAIAPQSMGVASMENGFAKLTYLETSDHTKYPYEDHCNLPLPVDEALEVVACGLGRSEDFIGKEVKGKVALMERGELNFSVKINNAAAAGAKLAIIYNHQAGGEELMVMATKDITIPGFAVAHSTGLALIEKAQKINVRSGVSSFPSLRAGKTSDFSNWGVSNDLELKTDIIAPGGNIYSTINDNKYINMSGTSMATPHVSGGVALVSQALASKKPDLKGEKRYQYIKNVLMATAKPMVDPESKVPVSPRKQGAGLMNLPAALSGDVVLTNEAKSAGSLMLGELGTDSFTVKGLAENFGDQPKTYQSKLVLTTDEVANGQFQLKPRKLKEITGPAVTVPAKSSKMVEFAVDASAFREELSRLMPNGYFLEGYLLLASENDPELSMPFVGFRGEWNKLPVMEKSIYEYQLAKEKPIYYSESSRNFTHFSSKVDKDIVVAGELEKDANGQRRFDAEAVGISPNKDGKNDFLEFQGVMLRNNYAGLYRILSESGQLLKVGFDSIIPSPKNHYSGNPARPRVTNSSYWIWDGLLKGRAKEGTYIFDFQIRPNIKEGKDQHYQYKVKVDLTAPSLESGSFDEATRRLKFTATDWDGVGVQSVEVSLKGGDVLQPEADGSYKIPAGQELKNVQLKLTDRVYNAGTLTGEDVVNAATLKGKLEIESKSLDVNPIPSYDISVKDKQGKPYNYRSRLPLGEYTVEAVNVQEGYVCQNPSHQVLLTQENPQARIQFEFRKEAIKSKEMTLRLRFAYGTYKMPVKIEARLDNGSKVTFEKDPVLSTYYRATLPFGNHEIHMLDVEEGWMVSPKVLPVTVSVDSSDSYRVLYSKGAGGRIEVEATAQAGQTVPKVEYMATNSVGVDYNVTDLLPFDYYTVKPKHLVEGFYSDPAQMRVTVGSSTPNPKAAFKWFASEGIRGSITPETKAFKEGYTDLFPEYEVTDYYGKTYEDLKNLPLGTYIVRPVGYDPKYYPKPLRSEIKLTQEAKDATPEFTFKKHLDEAKNGKLVVSIEAPHNYAQKVSFDLVGSDGKVHELTFSKDNLVYNQITLPYDAYTLIAKDVEEDYYVADPVKRVVLSSSTETVSFAYREGTEAVPQGSLNVVAKDPEGTSLSGATYQVVNHLEKKQKDLANLPYGVYRVKLTKSPKGALPLYNETQVTVCSQTPHPTAIFRFAKDPNFIDKEPLEALLIKAEGIQRKDFTPASLEVLDQAIAKAKTALAKERPTQGDLDAALKELQDALDQLQRLVLRGALIQKIHQAQTLEASIYTKESFAALEKALSHAQAILTKEQASQKEVDEAAASLAKAMEELVVLIPVDYTHLKALIETTEKMDLSAYTEESVKSVQDALATARKILAAAQSTQNDVNRAYATLDHALKALVEKIKVVKDNLKQLIEKAQSLTLENYTMETRQRLEESLKAAQAVFANDKATQKDVNLQEARLRVHLEAMVSILPVDRVGGVNRYETAVLTSKKYFAFAQSVVLTTGEFFQDSISAAPLAAALNAPLLLNGKDRMDLGVLKEIQRLGAKKVVLIGGSRALSKGVEDQLKAAKLEVSRIAGSDRYETALLVAKEWAKVTNQKFSGAVLVSGETYQDGLAASSLAVLRKEPILLVGAKGLSKNLSTFVKTAPIESALIVGGTRSVSEATQQELQGLKTQVARLAGADRYETAARVAQEMPSGQGEVFVVSGDQFADALVLGVVAGRAKAPILLARAKELPPATRSTLQERTVKHVTLLGGTRSLSEALRGLIENIGLQ